MIPLIREVEADLETPVSVYLKLATAGPAFLLESVTGGEHVARYSFVGTQPRAAYVVDGLAVHSYFGPALSEKETHTAENPLSVLRAALAEYQVQLPPNMPRLVGGLVGYLSYDAARYFEPRLQIPLHSLPDGVFLLVDTFVAFDHTRGRALAITYPRGNASQSHAQALARLDDIQQRLAGPLPARKSFHPTRGPARSSHARSEFEAIVARAKEYVAAGDIFQVVLSQSFMRPLGADPFAIYRALRRLNPSPYMFFLDFGEFLEDPAQVLGASPEMHVRLEGNQATVRPIAGTRPRGETAADDAALETELLADAKERAEHVMLVDLGRNDLGRVCEYGSVQVSETMVVERYSHVMHIVSQVDGKLQPGLDAFDLLAATFPAGTVSGAPKVRAMEIVAELEKFARGPYAGIVGYIGFDGSMDTCITLRTMYTQGNHITVQAGAGIVADSVPAHEYEETLNKAMALSKAIDTAEQVASAG